MENRNIDPSNPNDSSVDMILMVVILLIVIGFGVWWFAIRNAPTPEVIPIVNTGTSLPTGTGTINPIY